MLAMLQQINGFIWGVPALFLILGVGIFISLRTGFVQIRFFPRALHRFTSLFKKKRGDNSSYRALCTALAATVGTGNIVGVAGAISLGGPGAIFWMWICAFLGMAIKYAEAVLAVRFRQNNINGEIVAGPMYMIQNGLHKRWKPLASIYCFLGVVAAFGVGNATQINAVISGVNGVLKSFSIHPTGLSNFLMGAALAVLIAAIFFGGAKRIGKAAEALVPLASVIYIVLCLGVLLKYFDRIPVVFQSILHGAFSPKAVTGGLLGSMLVSLRVGASRGVFTNEAGMGTASIAHGAADVEHPCDQGLMGIMEVFLDTIVICSLTALVILLCDIGIPYGTDASGYLTSLAFASVYGDWVGILITFCLCLFAIATVVGWGLYGLRCAQYLFGDAVWKRFVVLQILMVVFGAMLQTGTVWMLSEIINGLMAIPNLFALALLTPELANLTKTYQRNK